MTNPEFEELHKQVCEWTDALPGDYERQEKFFLRQPHPPGFSDWRKLVTKVWDREKVVIYLDYLDVVGEKLSGYLKANPKFEGGFKAAKKEFERAFEAYNRQVVLYYIVRTDLPRVSGDTPLFHDISTKTLEKSLGKGQSLETFYYNEGNSYFASALKKLEELSHDEKIGKVIAPLNPDEMKQAIIERIRPPFA